jgi:hypothetical protein
MEPQPTHYKCVALRRWRSERQLRMTEHTPTAVPTSGGGATTRIRNVVTYGRRRKVVPANIFDLLTGRALAYLAMEHGHFHPKGNTNGCYLSTGSFTFSGGAVSLQCFCMRSSD